jgi:release factor glutamine methyltransferase
MRKSSRNWLRFNAVVTKETVQPILANAAAQLTRAGCDTPVLDAEVLLAHALGQSRTWLYTYPHAGLSPEQSKYFADMLARRLQREPVAYITGHKEFFALDFEVNRHTLIPRPETELLVETALTLARPNPTLTIVDVGAGSGCLAVTLAHHLSQARLLAVDISADALAVARRNAHRHGAANRISFFLGDLLAPVSAPVDMIVSNPPYVSQAALTGPAAAPEVSRWEPRLALAAGRDGLAVIRRLLPQAAAGLKPGGALLVEIGFDQGPAVHAMAARHFPAAAISIQPDLAGLPRLLVVKL